MWRQADDGGGVDGVISAGDCGDFEDGIAIGHGVEAGVIAEGTFEDGTGAEWAGVWIARIPADETGVVANEAFDNDFGVGGDPERDGYATNHGDAGAV